MIETLCLVLLLIVRSRTFRDAPELVAGDRRHFLPTQSGFSTADLMGRFQLPIFCDTNSLSHSSLGMATSAQPGINLQDF